MIRGALARCSFLPQGGVRSFSRPMDGTIRSPCPRKRSLEEASWGGGIHANRVSGADRRLRRCRMAPAGEGRPVGAADGDHGQLTEVAPNRSYSRSCWIPRRAVLAFPELDSP